MRSEVSTECVLLSTDTTYCSLLIVTNVSEKPAASVFMVEVLSWKTHTVELHDCGVIHQMLTLKPILS